MKVLRWGVCALAALLMTAGSSFANDSEIEAMKAAMDNMKQEMDAMRSTMSAEREAMRESAGGAPEALRSKGGNATVRIGGAVVVRYVANLESNESDAGNGLRFTGGEYATQMGWTMDTAKVTFDFQINEDLSAYIDVRSDKFDKAYFQWNNIGGTGLGVQAGFIGIPCGMYDAGWSPTGAVLINNPYTKSAGLYASGDFTATEASLTTDDLTRMGVKAYYELDQFKFTATIFNGYNNDGTDGMAGNSATNDVVNNTGELVNPGIDHTFMIEYSPAFLEGLHFSATYVGAMYNSDDSNTRNTDARGTQYVPTFDLGVAYVGEKFSAWLTSDFTYAPGWYSESYLWNIGAGVNYNITERLAVGVGYDFGLIGSSNDFFKGGSARSYESAYSTRAQFGAKYTLCNGVWFRGTYSHTWFGPFANGNFAQNDDWVRGQDRFVFETGVSF